MNYDNTNPIHGSNIFQMGEVPNFDCFHLSAVNMPMYLPQRNRHLGKTEFHMEGGHYLWSGKQRDTLEKEILNCHVAAGMK